MNRNLLSAMTTILGFVLLIFIPNFQIALGFLDKNNIGICHKMTVDGNYLVSHCFEFIAEC